MPDDDYLIIFDEVRQVIFAEVDNNEITLEEEEQTSEDEIHQIIRDPKMVEDIVKESPPKYWRYFDHSISTTKTVSRYSLEYEELFQDIWAAEIKLYPGSAQMTKIRSVLRIQNTVCYARFVVRAKQMKLGEGVVYYRRMFLIRHRSEVHALFNSVQDDELQDINAKLVQHSQGNCYFYASIPQIHPSYVILVAYLATPQDWSTEDVLVCHNPANFYLEYIVSHCQF